MRMHVPEELPKEAGLWMCDCGDKKPHGVIVTPKGFITSALTTKREARIYVDAMLRQKYLTEAEAEKVRQQIAESPLTEPVPNDFHACDKCWIPVKHGHFTVNDEEAGVRFSVRGAMIDLNRLKKQGELTDEDVARIEDQINAAGLPEASDIDLLLLAQDELERRKREELDGTLSMLAGVLEMSLRRHSQMGKSPVFPSAAPAGSC